MLLFGGVFFSCKKTNVPDSQYTFHKYVGQLHYKHTFDILDDTIQGVTHIDTIYNNENIFLKRDYIIEGLTVFENPNKFLAISIGNMYNQNDFTIQNENSTLKYHYFFKCIGDSIDIDLYSQNKSTNTIFQDVVEIHYSGLKFD
jgi:hypothetical protein